LAAGIGSSESSLIVKEGVEVILVLGSLGVSVLKVHDKKGDLQQGTGNSRDACPCEV
jgi:hypothetical protein